MVSSVLSTLKVKNSMHPKRRSIKVRMVCHNRDSKRSDEIFTQTCTQFPHFLMVPYRRACGFQNLVWTPVQCGHNLPPLVEIGLGQLPKLGVDMSPHPHAHRPAWICRVVLEHTLHAAMCCTRVELILMIYRNQKRGMKCFKTMQLNQAIMFTQQRFIKNNLSNLFSKITSNQSIHLKV